jgi:hypothetical protein
MAATEILESAGLTHDTVPLSPPVAVPNRSIRGIQK